MKNPFKGKRKGKGASGIRVHQASSAFPDLSSTLMKEEGAALEEGGGAPAELGATYEEEGGGLFRRRRKSRVRKSFYHTNEELSIFGEHSLMVIAALVTLFLQIISFVTTYGGAVPYFSEVFFLAPALFAVAVQSVVYFLENSIRRDVHLAKIVALILAMACSSYFSYIGIYNQVNSPTRYYEETYDVYRNDLQAEYDKQITGVDVLANDGIQSVINAISEEFSRNLGYRNELKAALDKLDAVQSTSTEQLAAPRREDYDDYEEYAAAYDAYVNSSVSGQGKELTRGRNKILREYGFEDRSEIEEARSELTGSIQTMRASLVQIDATLGGSEVTGVGRLVEQIRTTLMERVARGEEGSDLSVAITQLVEMSNRITEEDVSADDVILSIRLKAMQREQLLADFEEVAARPTEKEDGTLREAPIELKNGLESEVKQAVTELNRVLTLKGEAARYQEEDYILYDIYDMPIINLMNANTRNMAAICLTIAVLVDALSLIFAMIFKKRKNVLVLGTTNQVLRGEDLLFEKNIVASIMLSLKSEKGINLTDDVSMNEILERLAEFIGKFTCTNVSAEKGFTMYAEQSDLRHYEAMVSFLSQFDLVKIVSPDYFNELYKTVSNGELSVEAGKNVVLMKTKFLLWCNDKWNECFTITDYGEVVV